MDKLSPEEAALLRDQVRNRKPCLHCNEPVVFYADGRGWRHEKGGGLYAQRCDNCGFRETKSPPATRCPSCGSVRRWGDDHVAEPVR